jgi:D-alanyl-D-alanine carboxypeptidase
MKFDNGLKRLLLSLIAASILLVPGTAAAALPLPATTTVESVVDDHPDDRNAALRAALEAVVDAGATGVIALVDDGHDQTRLAVGSARIEPRQRLQVRDQVRVGSITKTVIATIALQLVGEGRLRLDDTVERWLPGTVSNGSAITLQMLLNHTSGIFNYTDDEAFIPSILADPYRQWTPQELIDVAAAHPPVFAPGQGWSYSNTGYILAGLILQRATGQPVEDLVQERIVKPLHLRDTFFATSARFRGRYAHGYAPPSFTGAGYEDLSPWPPSWAWAAGSLVSNAPDLARFYHALLSGRLLSQSLLVTMTTTVDVGPGFAYGLGIYTVDTPCGSVWGHDGGIPGYVSYALNTRDGSRSTILLLPTQPDEAINTAIGQALLTAVCQMFDQAVPVAAASGAAATSGPTLASTLRSAALVP